MPRYDEVRRALVDDPDIAKAQMRLGRLRLRDERKKAADARRALLANRRRFVAEAVDRSLEAIRTGAKKGRY